MKQLSKLQSNLPSKALLSMLFFSILPTINCYAGDEYDDIDYSTPQRDHGPNYAYRSGPEYFCSSSMKKKATIEKQHGQQQRRLARDENDEFIKQTQALFDEFMNDGDRVVRSYGVIALQDVSFVSSNRLADICAITNQFFEDFASVHACAMQAVLGGTISKFHLLELVNRLHEGYQLFLQMNEVEHDACIQVMLRFMHLKYASDFSQIAGRKVSLEDVKSIYRHQFNHAVAAQNPSVCDLEDDLHESILKSNMRHYLKKLEKSIEIMDNFAEKCCNMLLMKLKKGKDLAKYQFFFEYDYALEQSALFLTVLYKNQSAANPFYAGNMTNAEREFIAKLLARAHKANDLNLVLDNAKEPMQFMEHIDRLMISIQDLKVELNLLA